MAGFRGGNAAIVENAGLFDNCAMADSSYAQMNTSE
jgi:hypothetical protein